MPKKAITKGFPPIITSIPLLLFELILVKVYQKSQLGNHPIEILNPLVFLSWIDKRSKEG